MRILSPKFLVGIGLLALIALSAWLRRMDTSQWTELLHFLPRTHVLAPLLFMLVYAIGLAFFCRAFR